MKKLISGILAATMMFTLTACGGGTEAPDSGADATPNQTGGVEIGIVLPTNDEPRWVQDETRFKDAIAQTDHTVQVLFSQADSIKEKQNVESLIEQGMKVLIICPQDGAAAAASVEAARNAGVKVIAYDRLITDTDAIDYYLTFDSVAVGRAQGQYLVDNATGEKGQPLYLYAGAATDNNAFLFFQGAWEVLQPKIADGTFVVANSTKADELKDKAELTRDEQSEIIGQVTTEWNFETAKTKAESNLTASELKGDVLILAPNDGTARSIADTFAANPDITSYVVTGQDAEVASIQYIIDGKQSMTVLKDVRVLSSDAITMAMDILAGNTPETTTTYNNNKIEVPAKQAEVVTVDQSNVQSTIFDSGYYEASQFENVK